MDVPHGTEPAAEVSCDSRQKTKPGTKTPARAPGTNGFPGRFLETVKYIGTQGLYSLQGEAGPDPSDPSLLTGCEARTDDVPGKLVFCCHFFSPWLPPVWHSIFVVSLVSGLLLHAFDMPLISSRSGAWLSYLSSGQMEPSAFQSPSSLSKKSG